MAEPIVQLIDVTKRIGAKTIVQDLSFAVNPGEVFGLLGPNGAGKTTTIRLMVGLIRLSAGEILIGGRSIRTQFTEAIARVGAIVEAPQFYEFLTGRQNLAYFLNLSRRREAARIGEVVRFLGMAGYIDDRVGTYSLGMKQRLGIAQALLDRPAVLILDEPTNGLDPAGIKELREHLRYLAAAENVAVIVSSHILSEMELLCDRVAIIKKGRLLDVRSLTEAAGRQVRFEIDRPEEAARVLAQAFPELSPAAVEGGLLLGADRESTARINAYLVGAGFRVFGIRPQGRTLEDVFMEVTVDERVDAADPQRKQ
jgi:ABC-2 type transport system ATP-binding protein